MNATNLQFLVLVISVTAISANVFDNSINDVALPVCREAIKDATTRAARGPVPLSSADLKGTWISASCETRPGLEYVMRNYQFASDGKMLLQLHVYEDSSCRIPRYTIRAEGHFSLERKSYVTPGGTEADYSFDRVNIKTYSSQSSQIVVRKMAKFHSCNAEAMLRKLKPGQVVALYESPWIGNQTSETVNNCWEFISWNELQLMRLDAKTGKETGTNDTSCARKELYVGDLHTDPRYQKEYRPTAYQTPLVEDKCLPGCHGCNKSGIRSARINKQVTFPMVAQEINGYWASVRCEVQRYGLFLTRILHFSSTKPSWNLKQQYYYDPNCAKPMYTILAGGSVKELNNTNVPIEIDMRIMRMSIIPEDKQFAGQLNRLPPGLCGKPEKWSVGKRRDITVTGGCAPIGLLVPSKEPEIYKIVLDDTSGLYLHLGQTPTWPRKRNRTVPRPTSWGPGLRKCRKHVSQPVEDNRIRPVANARTSVEHNGSVIIDRPACTLMAILIASYVTLFL